MALEFALLLRDMESSAFDRLGCSGILEVLASSSGKMLEPDKLVWQGSTACVCLLGHGVVVRMGLDWCEITAQDVTRILDGLHSDLVEAGYRLGVFCPG